LRVKLSRRARALDWQRNPGLQEISMQSQFDYHFHAHTLPSPHPARWVPAKAASDDACRFGPSGPTLSSLFFADAPLRATDVSRHSLVAALFRTAALLRAAARRACTAARRLAAWLEQRRIANAAFHDFQSMSERDLIDIGLTRVDVHRVAWDAPDRIQDRF
jgi:uncharacterized protein YjiS (DUF1127 family)